MNSLYAIKNKYIELFEQDDISEEDHQLIGQELAVELLNKAENIVGYYINQSSGINALKDEIERLTNIKKSKENSQEKFKEYVKQNMEELGIEKIDTPIGKIAIAKNPISVEIINEESIPFEFKRIKSEVDKTAIKEHFKNTGELVEGTRIISDRTSLRIK